MTVPDIAALPRLPLSDRKQLPAVSAVYFALDENGRILYIGKTVNLAQRWATHHRYAQLEQLGSVSLAWMECLANELGVIEASLIQALCPSLNGSFVPSFFASRLPTEASNPSGNYLTIRDLSLPEWIALMRKRAGLSQKHLADLIGVTTTTVANWENGRTVPVFTFDQIRIFLKALNTSLDYLPYETQRSNSHA